MSNPWATIAMKLAAAPSSDTVTVEQRIEELIEEHGSVNRAAREIGLEPAYLYRLQRQGVAGLRMSDETLQKMGLVRVVTFTRIEE